MKTNEFVKDLNTKSAAELNDELVAAKKELFNLRGSQKYCKNPDCYCPEGKRS